MSFFLFSKRRTALLLCPLSLVFYVGKSRAETPTRPLPMGEISEKNAENGQNQGNRRPFMPASSPTYRKFFLPKTPLKKKPIISPIRLPQAEYYGARGHRKHKVDLLQSSNAQSVIGRKTLENFAEGTNALAALAYSTPGANFTSTDASGLDAYANTFYLRGYDQTQLGFTMDGIPLGTQGFGGLDGVDASQIIIQENIASLAASQGAGALDTPSSTTLGGTVAYTLLEPSDKLGVHISQQFGSFNGYRTYGRFDSGKLNPTGTKFSAGFVRNSQNLWSGGGFLRQEQMNFKAVQPIANIGKLTLTSQWADVADYAGSDNTPHMMQSLGYGNHNFYPDYPKSKIWSNACNTGQDGADLGASPEISNSDICNLAYQYTSLQRNYLEGLKGDFQLSPALKSSAVVYGQVADDKLGATSPFYRSPGAGEGYPVLDAERSRHAKGRRVGVTQNFEFKFGRKNTLNAGIWYENNRTHMPVFFYGFTPSSALPNNFTLKDRDGFLAYNQVFTTNTFQFYIEDHFQIARNMQFSYGFKSLVQSENGGMYNRASDENLWQWGLGSQAESGSPATYSARPAYGRLTQSNAFLPHFNYDWKFMPKHEFYFDVAENMRPLDAGGSAWSASLGNASDLSSAQSAFNQEKQNLRGERTWNYVVGYRYDGKPFSLGLDYYHTDYIGRLGTVTTGAANSPTASTYLADLGNETMDGVDLIGVAHLSRIFKMPSYLGKLDYMSSFSYNHGVYENDCVPTSDGCVNIKGVQQIFYPRYMYKTNVHFQNGRLTWDLNVNYNSRQNITYSGDLKNPGYWTSEFTGALLLGRKGAEDQVKMTFSVSNLFGQKYATGSVASGADLIKDGAGNENGTPNLDWVAPREFFGSVNVAF